MNSDKQRNQASIFRHVLKVTALSLIVFLCVSIQAQAQKASTDRDNPTPLNSNSISGIGVNQKTEYFYSLAATPGDVKIVLAVTAGKQAAVSSVDISVFDADANTLMSAYANPDHGSSLHTMRTINLKSPQTLLLAVTVSPGVSTYKIWLSGSISLQPPGGTGATESSAPPAATNGASNSDVPNLTDGLLKLLQKQVIQGTGVNKKTQRIFEFSAGPGDVTFQLTVKSLSNAAVSSVDIELVDHTQSEIAAGFANPSLGETKQTIIKAHLQQKQNLTLKVIVSPGVNNYRLTVSGALNSGLDEPAKMAQLNQLYRDESTGPFNRPRRFTVQSAAF